MKANYDYLKFPVCFNACCLRTDFISPRVVYFLDVEKIQRKTITQYPNLLLENKGSFFTVKVKSFVAYYKTSNEHLPVALNQENLYWTGPKGFGML